MMVKMISIGGNVGSDDDNDQDQADDNSDNHGKHDKDDACACADDTCNDVIK